jgi:hypothetical protein
MTNSSPGLIVETSANQFYIVWETGKRNADHCWLGLPAKFVKGKWVENAKDGRSRGHPRLISKTGSRIVEHMK